MLPDHAVPAPAGRSRIAALAQLVSVACFLAAATTMAAAGGLHAAGRQAPAGLSATLGYGLGVLGIICGALALILGTSPETTHEQEQP